MKFREILIAATAAASLLALSTGGALAHSDEYLDTQQAPHGGQQRMAGIYHLELVVAKDSKEAKENPVVVYVTDHEGKTVSTSGAKGTVTILSGKAKATINLVPDGENRLKGSGTYASTPDMKAVVSVTMPSKPTAQARFTPLAKSSAMAQEGQSGHKMH
jgi:hypothetical protein